ncbi:hypothetical protein GF351_00995 [Candidatus Woesearchaeota archaeon]|nr:hypothetical protein [Candidatus Woesearchaeota archaeon]
MKAKRMKAMVVYYSRTGNTRKIGQEIAKELDADVEEIVEKRSREGFLGYLRSGKEALTRKLVEIMPLDTDLSAYDLVVIGTPVWGFAVSSPVRTYMTDNRNRLRQSKLAFFCTMGGSGDKKTFSQMQEIAGREPVAVLSVKAAEIGSCSPRIKAFVKKLTS